MSACLDCPRFNVQTRRTRCCCDPSEDILRRRVDELTHRDMARRQLGNRKSRRAAEARSRRA